MTVSICIPATRKGPLLRDAVASALKQTVQDLEVVVSDDNGSLAGDALALDDPRVNYHKNLVKLGMARNTVSAVDRSIGKFVAFLHDDDELTATYLERVLQVFDRDPTLGVVFTNCELSGAVTPGAQRARLEGLRAGRHDDALPMLLRHNPIVPSLAVFRRQAWDDGAAVMPLPDITTADTLIWIRIALAGWPFYFLDEPLVRYRTHAQQLTADALTFRENVVLMWDAISFERPELERSRQDLLARALVDLGALRLMAGTPTEAKKAMSRARALAPAIARGRRLCISALCVFPAAGQAVVKGWRLTHRFRRQEW